MWSDQEDEARSGNLWTDQEYASVVDGLRDGRPVEDIARTLQRSTGAVRRQLSRLVPVEVKEEIRGERNTDLWLREKLTSTADHYDWRAVARENYAASGLRYWTYDECELLREAWEQSRCLPDLAAGLRASEIQVARYLCSLGFAASVEEVVACLGATPGGTAEVRTRMAADRAAAAVWVLVVDGTGKKMKGLGDGCRRHVSIHATRDLATQRLSELLEAAGVREHGPIAWSIVQRTVGEDSTGDGTAGQSLNSALASE